MKKEEPTENKKEILRWNMCLYWNASVCWLMCNKIRTGLQLSAIVATEARIENNIQPYLAHVSIEKNKSCYFAKIIGISMNESVYCQDWAKVKLY